MEIFSHERRSKEYGLFSLSKWILRRHVIYLDKYIEGKLGKVKSFFG